MKKSFFIIAFILCSHLTFAQEPIGLHTDLSFASRSIFHGWDIAADNLPVVHPYIENAIGKTGFSVAFWASVPLDRSKNLADDLEFYLKYGRSFFRQKSFAFKLNGYADFISCPNAKMTNKAGEDQVKMLYKFNAGITFENLVQIANSSLVPAYQFYHFTPFGDIDFQAGSVHEVSLFYTIPVLSGIKVGGAANYHTGAFDAGSGWTHATSQVSTSVKLGPVNVYGAVNYQWSFDVREDVQNELWVQLGVKKSF